VTTALTFIAIFACGVIGYIIAGDEEPALYGLLWMACAAVWILCVRWMTGGES
jgi:hypothetical protein